MVLPGEIERSHFSLLPFLVQHEEADFFPTFSASQQTNKKYNTSEPASFSQEVGVNKCHQHLLFECMVGWKVPSLTPLLGSLQGRLFLAHNCNWRSASILILFCLFAFCLVKLEA